MSSSSSKNLLLAGGGHSHALLLKRWAMWPKRRPHNSITLVSRSSTALYSGMVPGLIAGLYERDELTIDLRQLCDRAGVAFVQAEITGLDPEQKCLKLCDRPALRFDLLSLNVGAVSRPSALGIPIKPLEVSLDFLESENPIDPKPLRVIGAGAAGLEVVLALRRRWPQRALQLQQHPGQLDPELQQILRQAGITLVDDSTHPVEPSLLCTGTQGPAWLSATTLPLDHDGRILTDQYLRVNGCPSVFASGDCAVISTAPRPASVGLYARWPIGNQSGSCMSGQTTPAVAASTSSAATDREPSGCRLGTQRKLANWSSQNDLASQTTHRLRLHGWLSGQAAMSDAVPMACRGCAAKFPAQPLEAALEQVGLSGQPEDAARLDGHPGLLQSMDGFPALGVTLAKRPSDGPTRLL